jgi:integrase
VVEADGSHVRPDTLSARWKRLEKAAGVRPIGIHGARHTHATLALAAGARLDVVSRQLGHASIAITADIYTHADETALQEAARRMGTVLGEGAR